MIDIVAQSAVLRLLLLMLLFALVVAITDFASQAITARQLVRRRIFEGATAATPMMRSLRSERVKSSWLKLVNSIEQKGISLVDTKDATLRQRLIAAGFSAPYAPRVFTLLRLVAVITLPLLYLLAVAITGSSPSMFKLYIGLIIAAALGLYVPALLVRIRADRRQEQMVNGFPGALGSLLVCVGG